MRQLRVRLAVLMLTAWTFVGCAKDAVTNPANDAGTGGDDNSGTGTPLAPSDLGVTPTCSGLVVYWQDNAMNEAGFHLYRQRVGVDAGPVLFKTLGPNVITCTDASVAKGGIYFYKVHSYNDVGESGLFAYSSGTAIGAPSAPSNVTAVLVSSGTLRVSWVDHSDDETGFEIRQRSRRCDIVQDFSAWTPVLSVGPNQAQANLTVTEYPPTQYIFSVYAKNACGYSTISNQATWGCY